MVFNSFEYIVFLPIMIIGFFLLPKKLKSIWLLIGSYYFYMSWSPVYAILMLISTVITFISGLTIGKSNTLDDEIKEQRLKSLSIALSFILNLGILFFFKYFDFTNQTLASALGLFNIEYTAKTFNYMLPVGISFYTFQALSYTMDVYRKKISPQKNFIKYALFVSFFPQLVAGPIEKSRNLIPQLENYKKFDYYKAKQGVILVLWGMVKKVIIADRLAILVNTVYNNPHDYQGFELVLATLCFAMQIYCDFSAYSDIARGSARIMGIDLMVNFRSPYFSKSISEFWRRWHISLNQWFIENLYIPLGGSRKGKVRTYINIMIVFLVSGLWHGAGLTYIVWGGLNGFFSLLGSVLTPAKEKIRSIFTTSIDHWSYKAMQIFFTFSLINVTWIFFRANSISDAVYIFKNLLVNNYYKLFDGTVYTLGLNEINFNIVLISVAVLIIVEIIQSKYDVIESILDASIGIRWTIYTGLIILLVIFGYYGPAFDASQFIYFQF